MEVVVGLDAGTTSTKAVTAGDDGVVRDIADAGYPLLVPAPGRAELDPRAVQAAALSALTAVVSQARERGDDVVAVALCAALHGLVPLDRAGMPAGPLVTWADGRAPLLHARTGTPVHPMSPLTKLRWLHDHDRELLLRTPRWGGVKELLVGALCDAGHVVDLSCASGTGLLDLRTRSWDEEALEVAGVRLAQLPEVLPVTQLLPLRADVARSVGLPAGTPVVLGAADGPLANLGTGAVRPGVAAVSIGTSAALRAVVPGPTTDPAGRLFCYALTDDRWVVGGALNNGGSVVRWAALALTDGPDAGETDNGLDARLLVEAGRVPVGSDGLLCLPHLLGERAPWWLAGRSGAYVGLRRDHRRAHLVRAAVEGVCQQLAMVADGLSAAGHPVRTVRATGGAVASSTWTDVLAAALDTPVQRAASPEGTGLGACLLGLHALGRLPDLDAAADLVGALEPTPPDAAAAARYRRTRPLVDTAAAALTDVLAALDAADLAD